MSDALARRVAMVRRQIEARGIRDSRVLLAMREVPRHDFVGEGLADRAYEDTPLPIGHGQTISQPYMIAWALEGLRLRGGEKVLEIGTGSGYQTALLARLAREVWSVEIVASLRDRAHAVLASLGIEGVHLLVGDGGEGIEEQAPFDRILVAAAAPEAPVPLVEQLAEGGILEAPIGSGEAQDFVRIRRVRGRIHRESLGRCSFVPLRGTYGFGGPGRSPAAGT